MRESKKSAKALSAHELSDYHYGMGLLWLDGYNERGRALYHLQKALEVNPAHREADRIRELIAGITRAGIRAQPGD